ncbi:hypothetical protein D3C72_1761640 [compost metagenome]
MRDLSDAEVSRRARNNSLPGLERNKYRQEEKVRGLRNKQKRESQISIDPSFSYDSLFPYSYPYQYSYPHQTSMSSEEIVTTMIIMTFILFTGIPVLI